MGSAEREIVQETKNSQGKSHKACQEHIRGHILCQKHDCILLKENKDRF